MHANTNESLQQDLESLTSLPGCESIDQSSNVDQGLVIAAVASFVFVGSLVALIAVAKAAR